MLVQLRFAAGLSSEEYVSGEGWRQATLDRCPRHGDRPCRFARHGTYRRTTPAGARIARWYCPDAHETFSLLPDCFAARLPGALDDVEQAVESAESARSLEAAADALRLDIELPGAMRWLRRRIRLVRASLRALIGLFPALLAGAEPTLSSFRSMLGVDRVLLALREIAERHLHALPLPLGFGDRPAGRSSARAPPNTTRGRSSRA